MSNLGLRKTHLSYALDEMKLYLNVCPIDKNLLYQINLFETSPSLTLPCSLIFNYQSRSISGLFGCGFNIAFYKKIYTASNNVYLEDSDGEIYEFTGSDLTNYSNSVLEAEITVTRHNQYTKYVYKDKYGNEIIFDGIGSFTSDYPTEMDFSNGEKFYAEYVSNRLAKYYNDSGCEILFECNGNTVSKVKYVFNNTLMYSADISYTNGFISKITEKKHISGSASDYEITSCYTFTYTDSIYLVSDEISENYYQFTFNNNVISVSDETNTYTIEINDDFTKVTDLHSSNYEKYYFDSNCNVSLIESGINNTPLNYKASYYRTDYDLLKHESQIAYRAVEGVSRIVTSLSNLTKTISNLTVGNSYILVFYYVGHAKVNIGNIYELNLPYVYTEDNDVRIALLGFQAESTSIDVVFSNVDSDYLMSENITAINTISFKTCFYSDEISTSTKRNLVQTKDFIGDIVYTYNDSDFNTLSSMNKYGKITNYTYEDDSSRVSTVSTNDIIDEYDYNEYFQVAEHQKRNTQTGAIYTENYTYENNKLTSYIDDKRFEILYSYLTTEDSLRKEKYLYNTNDYYEKEYYRENDEITENKYYNNGTLNGDVEFEYKDVLVEEDSIHTSRINKVNFSANNPVSYEYSYIETGVNKNQLQALLIKPASVLSLPVESYTYNSDRQITGITYSNGTTSNLSYNDDKLPSLVNNNLITYDSYKRISGIGNIHYTYDNLGNVILTGGNDYQISSVYQNDELVRRLFILNGNKEIEEYAKSKVHYESSVINSPIKENNSMVITDKENVLFSSFNEHMEDEFTNDSPSVIPTSFYYYFDEDERRYILKRNITLGNLAYDKTLSYEFEIGLDFKVASAEISTTLLKVESFLINNRYIRIYSVSGIIHLEISISGGDTYSYSTNLSITENTWQNLKLSVSEIEYYDDYYTYVYIGLGNSGEGYQVTDTCFGLSRIYVGSSSGDLIYMKDFYIIPDSTDVTPTLYNINKINSYRYYNKLNLLTKKEVKLNDTNKLTKYIAYSSNKMLISYERFETGTFSQDRSYTYYPNGNIKTISDSYFDSKNYTYDYLNRLLSDGTNTYSYNSYGDITSKNSISYSYDNYGRLISYNNQSITYDSLSLFPNCYLGRYVSYLRNKITGFYNDSNHTSPISVYTYNEFNLRSSKTVNNITTHYIYDDDLLITEYNNSKRIDYLYDNHDIIGFVYNNYPYFYIKDYTGLILGIADRNNSVITKYSYDGYGNVSISGSNTYIGNLNSIRYKGYYYDTETGYYYLKSRFYNPVVGRFITPDSINYLDISDIRGLNLYAYCNNNPLMYSDEDGHFAISVTALLIGAAIGALIGGTTAGIKAGLEGERGWDLAFDILGGSILGAASGIATTLGGAAGLAAVGGTIGGSLTLSTGAALGISVGVMVTGSMAKYSLECAASSSNTWNGGGFALSGFQGALQGAATFGLAYIGGKSGLFNGMANNLPTNDSFFLQCGGMTKLRSIVWASKVLLGDKLSKGIIVGGSSALAKWIIDKIIPDLY